MFNDGARARFFPTAPDVTPTALHPQAVLLCSADELPPAYRDGSPEAGLVSFAKAVGAAAGEALDEAVFVVQTGPPALFVLGELSPASVDHLRAVRSQLNRLQTLRTVDYAQATEDVERLAECMKDQFGTSELRRYQFVAIPRGGLIVLGLLSYALDLAQEQIGLSTEENRPLVVVDDCSLTGARFGQFLREHPTPQAVIFAPLYSHPDLRTAIESSESRVRACLSARDLRDHAPERQGTGYSTWVETWNDRLSRSRYWIGEPELLSFAWNEPDVAVWNAADNRVEKGWMTLSPALAPRADRPAVQHVPMFAGPLRPADGVIFGTVRDRVYVADLHNQRCFALDGTAADMWHALLHHGRIEAACDALLSHYTVDRATLRSDLHVFVQDLYAQHLLTSSDPTSHSA